MTRTPIRMTQRIAAHSVAFGNRSLDMAPLNAAERRHRDHPSRHGAWQEAPTTRAELIKEIEAEAQSVAERTWR